MVRRGLPALTELPGPGRGSTVRLDAVLPRQVRLTGRDQLSTSPRMKFSTASYASESEYWTGGDFMKYEEAELIGPPIPRSFAILAARTASMITPAELGESQTSSLYSRLSGTSPKARPSRRT